MQWTSQSKKSSLPRLDCLLQMDMRSAKQIGYHLAEFGTGEFGDPESHLPWAFSSAVLTLPDPEENGLHLPHERPEAYWLCGGDKPLIFHADGSVSENSDNPKRPLARVRTTAISLTDGRWSVGLDSKYGYIARRGIRRGQGFTNRWVFRHDGEELLAAEGRQEWDGDDDWVPDDTERFAQRFAVAAGWPSS